MNKNLTATQIQLSSVTKYYDSNTRALNNINLNISKGQWTTITGPSGSGKTTLTKLISRLYDVNEGKILIDDVDVKNYSLKSLRDQIAYIEQAGSSIHHYVIVF